MKNLFLPYNLAVIAKEKGFSESCFGLYVTDNYGGTKENPMLISVGGHWGSGINSSMIDCVKFNLKETECPAPLFQQMINWFRIKHDISIEVTVNWEHHRKFDGYEFFINDLSLKRDSPTVGGFEICETYETCIERAIEEALKLI